MPRSPGWGGAGCRCTVATPPSEAPLHIRLRLLCSDLHAEIELVADRAKAVGQGASLHFVLSTLRARASEPHGAGESHHETGHGQTTEAVGQVAIALLV